MSVRRAAPLRGVKRSGRPTARVLADGPAGDVQHARRVLEVEARALRRASRRLGPDFGRAVDLVAGCSGKIVVTGMGKSGQICRKIASTLASTGTPAFFLHAAEGVHGDLGMLTKADVVLALSYSGETEVIHLLPVIKRLALPLVAIVGRPHSTLGRAADVVLDAGVEEEACPMGLAPTASTTVALGLGDALAVAVLQRKGFRAEDFAVLHPGGHLGRRLIRVEELAHRDTALPLVSERATMQETLREMSDKRLGITGVVNRRGALVGAISDGDLRRALQRKGDLGGYAARDLMSGNPKTVPVGAVAEQALATMEKYSITSLFLLGPDGRTPVGIVHLHDLLRAGVV